MGNKKFIILIFSVSFYVFSGCGDEPAAWLEPQWGIITKFPEEYARRVGGIAVEGEGVYFKAIPLSNFVIKYDQRGFSKYYLGDENLSISDIGFGAGKGFACGSSLAGEGPKPFLASYDGEIWKEEGVTKSAVTGFFKVVGVEGDKCWLLCQVKGKGPRVCLWDGSSLAVFEPSGPAAYAARAPDTGYLYSWGPGNITRLSTDGGNTWVTEEAIIRDKGLELDRVYSGAAIGEELFIISDLSFSGESYRGVIRRTGAPGKGEYEVAFMSYHGPYFYNLLDIEFRNAGDGLAVGSHTTLHYTAGEWFLETTRELDFICVAGDPAGGYWAVADNHSGGPAGTFLLYQR